MKLFLTDLLPFVEEERKLEVTFGPDRLDGHRILKSSVSRFLVILRNDRLLKIFAEGSVDLVYSCDRCLTETVVSVPFSEEVLLDPEKQEDENHDPVYCFSDHSLDTDELLSEMIRPNLPLKVLCRPDCKGLCPVCGMNRNETGCSCNADSGKTRIAEALEKAFSFSKNKVD